MLCCYTILSNVYIELDGKAQNSRIDPPLFMAVKTRNSLCPRLHPPYPLDHVGSTRAKKWLHLNHILHSAPCFQPYVLASLSSSCCSPESRSSRRRLHLLVELEEEPAHESPILDEEAR